MRLDDLLVLIGLVHAKIIEKLAAVRDFAEESPAGGLVLLVFLKVLGEELNFLREDGDLHLRRTRILLMRAVLGDEFLLCGTLE